MDIENDPYASYKLLREEFEKKGYKVEEARVKDRSQVTFISPSGRIWQTQSANLSYPFALKNIRSICINKDKSYDLAKNTGIPIPYTQVITAGEQISPEFAYNLLHRFNRLIVKPTKASLARGLTLDISTAEELTGAIAKARTISPNVLIQEQVEGEEIRFTVIEGKVTAAILRRTPRVIGDGISTVSRLIANENIERQTLHFPYINYPILSDNIINHRFLTTERVLEKGEILELNRATMIRNGCSVYDILDKVHSSYIQPIEGLVSELGARFIVVDMFLSDFKQPKSNHNYWFIEFNTSPVLKLFYGCRDGKMYDIVPVLADTIDRWLHSPAYSID